MSIKRFFKRNRRDEDLAREIEAYIELAVHGAYARTNGSTIL